MCISEGETTEGTGPGGAMGPGQLPERQWSLWSSVRPPVTRGSAAHMMVYEGVCATAASTSRCQQLGRLESGDSCCED